MAVFSESIWKGKISQYKIMEKKTWLILRERKKIKATLLRTTGTGIYGTGILYLSWTAFHPPRIAWSSCAVWPAFYNPDRGRSLSLSLATAGPAVPVPRGHQRHRCQSSGDRRRPRPKGGRSGGWAARGCWRAYWSAAEQYSSSLNKSQIPRSCTEWFFLVEPKSK